MSTVTKPIVLDETAKQMQGTLEEIRDAIIGNDKAHYPVRIQIATPPEKTNYIVGDTVDLTGIIVNAIFDNGVPYDITEDCVFSPNNGDTITENDTSIRVTWTWRLGTQTQVFHASRAINVFTVQSLIVSTPPAKVNYNEGDLLDLTGMAVKAILNNDSEIDVTSRCTYAPAAGDSLTENNDTVIASLTIGENTYSASTPISVVLRIYGVEWDGTSTTAWSRTDSAAEFTDPVPYVSGATNYGSPFDDIMPWAGMVKEERAGGTMVKIPKFWYKITQNGTGIKIQISGAPVDGFSVSPAHMNRGDGKGERDVVYVGRYHCSSSYKSLTGQFPKTRVTRADFRTAIHNLGSTIWQMDFATRFTIWLLYLVEFAGWDSQTNIGYGCIDSSSPGIENAMGYTDAMPYHTGTTASTRTAYCLGTQYRNIEGLWDLVWDYLDGCYNDASGFNLILNPIDFSDSANGISVGIPTVDPNHDTGYPSEFSVKEVSGVFPTFIPSKLQGSDATYSCDSWEFSQNRPCIMSGAPCYASKEYGLFEIINADISSAAEEVGSRIMELPDVS